jgi:hypothetical protein
MSDEHWTVFIIFGVAMVIMARLDRLGKQLEAVCAQVMSTLARTQDERDGILREWRENKHQEAKDARQFWIFWSIVGVAAVGWYALAHYR